jgi:hypothetical protein
MGNKIVLCQYWTDNLSYGDYTFGINEKYCNNNGYIYHVETNTEKIIKGVGDRAFTWYKPKLIIEVLEKYNPDYILFLDADAIVCDFSRKIEEFIDETFDIICNQDYGPSKLNAGVFIMKNNDWVKNFIQQWWNICEEPEYIFYKNALWHDQTCFGILMDRTENIDLHIKIQRDNVLNNIYFKNPIDKNFIFHAFAYGNIKNRTIDNAYYTLLGLKKPIKFKLSEIADFYSTDKNYEHNYVKLLYSDLLYPLRETLNTFMEIGVANGNSAEMWRDYFINGTIVGADIALDIPKNYFDNIGSDRINLLNLNQSSEAELDDFSSLYSNVDVILDDGSHKMYDQQKTLAKLFKILKSGGIYILEDLHTSIEVHMPEKAIFGWGDPNKIDTLTMLENFEKNSIIKSDYMTEDEIRYLNENIQSVKVHRMRPDWSIASVIIKK